MKKVVVVSLAGLLVVVVGGFIAFRTITVKGFSVSSGEVSPRAAKVLQQKIDSIKAADADAAHRAHGSSRVELYESELESYLMYSLKDDIPAQVDSARVQLNHDLVALDTQITFPANATGNTVVDTLMGGTHNLSLKGGFVAKESRGKFDLKEVRVDGIPVPNVLIQALIKKYVNPKYPEVDLNEPFDMPWGIEELKIEQGKANVVY
jgi:hypothetical protein